MNNQINPCVNNYVRPIGLALAMTFLFSVNGRHPSLWSRIQDRYQRAASRVFFGRFVRPRNPVPIISFTFDDFPRSALVRGGTILRSYGAKGTYYASLGFMGRYMGRQVAQHMPVGQMFSRKDLDELLVDGHELGCHTFDHCHSWQTRPEAFEQSIMENMRALEQIFEGAFFRTLSYPVSEPRPQTKKRAAKYFMCCRGVGQGINVGRTDLNFLNAYFIREGRTSLEDIKKVIDQNCLERGWLIFATHDISETPTPFGCKPGFFEEVVKYALRSGTRVLPVADACELFTRGRVEKARRQPAELPAC